MFPGKAGGRNANDRGGPRRHLGGDGTRRARARPGRGRRKGGVFGATDGLYARFGEARVLDTPLAESAIVGIAVGAALNGLIPIAEIQFADFIHPAFDQIVSEAARTRYRSNGDWSVPIVIRTPFGGGVHGGLYHSQSIEAFYAHVPGLKVVVPSMPADAHGLLKSAIRDPDPVLFLEHKKVYRLVAEDVPDGTGDTVADMANGPREKSLLHPKTVALLESLGSENSHDCRSTACETRPGRVLRLYGLYSDVELDDGSVARCTVRRLLKTVATDERAVVTTGDRVRVRLEEVRGQESGVRGQGSGVRGQSAKTRLPITNYCYGPDS